MPHFVYSQSSFFVIAQAAFAGASQIRNASSNVFNSSEYPEGTQQQGASTIPRRFKFTSPSSRNARLGKIHRRTSGKPSPHMRRDDLCLTRQATPLNMLR